jgi:peptidyl-tRNA hydrolase, PTH1 family
MIRLLVGLGNPGPDYAATRHNAGFWWLEAAADKLGARLVPERSYFGLAARVNRSQGPLWLLMPQTFMNLSGKSVASLARFFKIAPEEILVAHDELDLLPGQLKLKQGGSHAGHNGLKDIDAQLGSRDYWRLRIGIGHPGVRAEVIDWVLKKPSAADREAIEQCIERSITALELLIDGPMDRAMMNLHAKPPRPKPPASTATTASARIPPEIKKAGGSDAQSSALAAGAVNTPAADHFLGRHVDPDAGDTGTG